MPITPITDTWESKSAAHEGSWWPELVEWLAQRSSTKTAPPSMGAPDKNLPQICDAPGTYVLIK